MCSYDRKVKSFTHRNLSLICSNSEHTVKVSHKYCQQLSRTILIKHQTTAVKELSDPQPLGD